MNMHLGNIWLFGTKRKSEISIKGLSQQPVQRVEF